MSSQEIIEDLVVPVDDTTRRLLEMLKLALEAEPPVPDIELHEGTHLEVVARTYEDWQRGVYGLRALVGVRLIERALEALA